MNRVFRGYVTQKCNQKMLCFLSHLTSASVLPGETGNPENKARSDSLLS